MEADLVSGGSPLAAEWNHANQLGSCTPDQLSQKLWPWRPISLKLCYCSRFTLPCRFLQHGKVNQPCAYKHLHCFGPPSHLVHRRAPSGVLCATRRRSRKIPVFKRPNRQPPRRPTDSGKGTSERSPWKLSTGLAFWTGPAALWQICL